MAETVSRIPSTRFPFTPDAEEVVYRGQTKTWKFRFIEDETTETPLVPADSSLYPNVQLLDPNREIYATATPPTVISLGNGWYEYSLFITEDVTATAAGKSFEFAAEMETDAGRREVYRTTFVVRDPAVVKSSAQGRFYVTITGRGIRVEYLSTTEVYSIKMSLIQSGSTSFIIEDAVVGSGSGRINKVTDGTTFLYYYDIPKTSISTAGVYQAHWDVQEAQSDHTELVFQILSVVDNKILEYVPAVKGLVDKLGKSHDTVWRYDQPDFWESLAYGLQLVNGVYPSSGWTFSNIPIQATPYLALASAWWLLNAQYGLATDLSFDFSGLSTTLSQDQTGGIESMLSRYGEALNTQFKEVKEDLIRNSSRVGSVHVRMTSYKRAYRDIPLRVSSGTNSSTILAFLSSNGLTS